MKRLFYLVFIGSFLFILRFQTYAQAQKLHFEHLTNEQGLSENSVWGIIQDRKGYMWFGTLNGLNRYDGYTITTFQFKPHDTTSISQNAIFTLYEDTEGLIWLGTNEGGICKFDPSTEKFTTYKPPQSKNQFIPALRAVSAIGEDAVGRIWAGNFGGELRSFDKQTGTFSQPYNLGYSPEGDADKHDAIFSIYKDRAGTLWIGNETGLHKLSFSSENNKLLTHPNVQITHYQHEAGNANSLSSNSVSSIYEDSKGMLWIGAYEGGGLTRFDRQTGTFTRYLHDPTDIHSLSNNSIFLKSITEDKQGNLWVGTVKGLNRLDTSRREFTRYSHDLVDASTLGNNTIFTLHMDKSGNLWVGTDNGISTLDFNQKPFIVYRFNPSYSQGLNGRKVQAICEDRVGNLWIGTELGLNHFNTKTGIFTHTRHNPEHHQYFTADPVIAIIEDRLGTIWMLNENKLSRFNLRTGEFSRFSGNTELDNHLKGAYLQHNSLYQDSLGTLWIGTGNIGLFSFNPATNQFKQYMHDPQNPNGLSDGQVNCILEDKEGNLWIGQGSFATTKLNRKTGRFSRYVHNPLDTTSISSNIVHTLFLDTDKNLWLGTVGGGLCRYHYTTQTFTTYAQKQGLPDGTVHAILEDDKGNLWLSTNKGISRFSKATGKFTNYDAADGLQSNLFAQNSAFKSKDGTLYFGGINGMNAFILDQLQPNPYVPPVVITRIKVFDQEVPTKREAWEMELKYDQNFFSFEFAALNYTNSNKNQYAYQLEGVDKDWVYSGTRRYVSYSDVAPGKYIFKVKGSNNDGIWNEAGTSILITIRPPWWRTWWAYAFYFLCFIAGVFVVDRLQRRRLIAKEREKAREKELAQARELEKAYKELGHQKEELQTTLEDLQATQAQLIQKEKMASLGELTAGIAHEIQNPLNFVNNFSEVSEELVNELKYGPFEKLPANDKEEAQAILNDLFQNLEKIHHHGKRADSIVKGMLQHSRTSSGEKQLTDINALVDEYLRLAYHGMRAKDKDFNAIFTLEADATIGEVNLLAQDIGRVLLNLFNNAFYATAQKKAQLNGQYQPQVIVTTKLVDSKVEIKVRDNGIGIPETVKQKIFQPFYTTKPTGEGTGLGLSLSYDIITKGHGGELKVESREGEYSEFTISLPLAIL